MANIILQDKHYFAGQTLFCRTTVKQIIQTFKEGQTTFG